MTDPWEFRRLFRRVLEKVRAFISSLSPDPLFVCFFPWLCFQTVVDTGPLGSSMLEQLRRLVGPGLLIVERAKWCDEFVGYL